MNHNPFNPNFKLCSSVSQPVLISSQRGRRREVKRPTFKTPYYESKRYTALCHQPFTVYFGFKPKHKHRSSVGYVTFTITVGERKYGPYFTDIWTTTKTFEGRHWSNITEQSFVVQKRLLGFYEKLEDGWDSYDPKGEPITGEMVLAKSGLQQIQGEEGVHYAL